MEPESPSPYPQVPATCPYPEPNIENKSHVRELQIEMEFIPLFLHNLEIRYRLSGHLQTEVGLTTRKMSCCLRQSGLLSPSEKIWGTQTCHSAAVDQITIYLSPSTNFNNTIVNP